MKLTLRNALVLFSLSPLVLANRSVSHREGDEQTLSPEDACRKKLVQEELGEEAEQFQIQCQCYPTDDHKEESSWKLSCKFGCEACFQEECAFMTIDHRFVTSPSLFYLGQTSCFHSRDGDEFCHHMDDAFAHWATINGNMCLHAGYCPSGDEDSPLFQIKCSNLGSQYAVDTCKKDEIAKLERGHPFHFFAYMFGGTADEEPTVGACRPITEVPSL